jgi:hypothetical protein
MRHHGAWAGQLGGQATHGVDELSALIGAVAVVVPHVLAERGPRDRAPGRDRLTEMFQRSRRISSSFHGSSGAQVGLEIARAGIPRDLPGRTADSRPPALPGQCQVLVSRAGCLRRCRPRQPPWSMRPKAGGTPESDIGAGSRVGQAGFWPMVMPGAPSGVGSGRTEVSPALCSRLEASASPNGVPP